MGPIMGWATINEAMAQFSNKQTITKKRWNAKGIKVRI